MDIQETNTRAQSFDIDLKKVKTPYNWVLVKLDDDFDTYHNTDTGGDTGIHVAPWGINQASHVAVTGEVVCVPQALQFNGYELNRLKKDKERSPDTQRHVAELRRQSMAFDVPIEIQVGFKVYFEYTTRLNAIKEGRVIENADGKFLILPYDLLVMAFRPGTDFNDVKISDVYMLNGFVLIKPLEYATEKTATGIKGVKTEMDIFIPVQPDAKYVKKGNIWYANVLSVGCGVRSYADFPGKGGEHFGSDIVPGLKIAYDGRQQKRLEVEHHRVIFKKHTLYRIQRKDIHGYYPDGNIS